ncbi:MAG: precorrin-2 dehydrogenase/sirohydrochlorin ferrochelatase family protein [Thermodesulfobacteriota bacterium]
MTPYPINLDLRGRRCLVVGGGSVGARKARTLVDCGAAVLVVSPETDRAMEALADAGCITLKRRPYRSSDLADVFLAFAATDHADTNREIAEDARRRSVLCNIADRPEDCDFTLPARVVQGDLLITVSTSGQSPALAKKLRKDLQNQFGPEYAVGLRLLGAARKRLLAVGHDPETHKHLFRGLIRDGMIQHLRDHRIEAVDRLLREALGPEYTYENLLESHAEAP